MEDIYIGIDAGLSGHIVAINEHNKVIDSFIMPTKKTLVYEAKKKKVGTYKNGNTKYKTINPAKYKRELDIPKFYNLVKILVNNNFKKDIFIGIESQRGIAGNSARSSTTISFNYGQLLGSLKIIKYVSFIDDAIEVPPQQWKKHFGLLGIKDKDERKQASIDKAKELGFEAESHDEAEAFLLAIYIKDKKD